MAHAELDSDRADCEGSRVRGTYCYFNCPVGGLLLRVLSGSRWGRKAMSALPRSTGMPGHYLPIRDMIALSMTWLYRPSFSRVSVNQRTPMATQVAPITLMRSPVLIVAPEAILRAVAYTCLTAAGFQRSRQESGRVTCGIIRRSRHRSRRSDRRCRGGEDDGRAVQFERAPKGWLREGWLYRRMPPLRGAGC